MPSETPEDRQAREAAEAQAQAEAQTKAQTETSDDGESQFVYMTNPNIEGTAGPIARKSFNNLWVHKGWKLAPPPTETAPA